VKLVADMMDNAVNKRYISSARTKDEIIRKQQQHLWLDKAYDSTRRTRNNKKRICTTFTI
jgi:ribosomal protein S2